LRFRLFDGRLRSWCGDRLRLRCGLQHANFRSRRLRSCRGWSLGWFSRYLYFRFRLRLRCFRRRFNDLNLLNVFYEARANLWNYLLREVFESNTFGNFMRHRVGRHTHVYALPARVFHYLLVVELQLFGKIVNSNFVLTCRHN